MGLQEVLMSRSEVLRRGAQDLLLVNFCFNLIKLSAPSPSGNDTLLEVEQPMMINLVEGFADFLAFQRELSGAPPTRGFSSILGSCSPS
jgi:hypothetical protein